MDIGRIQPKEIVEEMKESYLDYAMSVIVSRALPDIRDGLKPVHRRILYVMHELGLNHFSRFRKSAAVVGDTIAKYHPHGDIAVYDALVRMAQDFSLRYPLVDGQGNFGSIDGDSAAAYRYTESRMTKMAEEMLKDTDKETIEWLDNYDGTRKEPAVLPSKLPQLILNGTLGIAVGMATNIPPHNLREVCDALAHLIDHKNVVTEDLFQFIKGPDFPTGGAIYNRQEIIEAYSQGKGPFIMRGRAEIIENPKSKKAPYQIIISEIPYQVNKAQLVERMAELIKEKKVEGVKTIRDESDREGMRIVVDLGSNAYPQKILNKFYKFTDLQKTFHLNMLALVGGIQPQVLSLRDLLWEWVLHRREVVKRRTQFDLDRAKERSHILEGLKKALSKIDAIIKLIKSSPTKEEAHKRLKNKFRFSDLQATAILEMKLQALAGLERKKVEDELKEKLKLINELTLILKSPQRILGVIKKELKEIKDSYGDERRTKVFISKIGEISEVDLIPQEETIITITKGGYIKRTSPSSFRVQRRGGKGIIGMVTKGEDIIEHFLTALTHDRLLFFTSSGKVLKNQVYEIPVGSRVSRGRALINFLDLGPEEQVTALIPLPKSEGAKFLIMATRNGIIKKTSLENFEEVRRTGIIAIKLQKNDVLGWVEKTSGEDDIILVSQFGQSIRFSEKDVRSMGRVAKGIKGMRLKKGDKVVAMGIVEKSKINLRPELRSRENQKSKINDYLLVVTEDGYGKKTEVEKFKKQRRGGSGVKAIKVTQKTGKVISAKVVVQEEELIAISQGGHAIKMNLKNIPVLNRATQGVRIMRLENGDKIASITCL